MKKKLIFPGLLIFTAYILLFPEDAVPAAARGLVLWYDRVLPTLLPFAILSNILIASGYVQYLSRITAPLIRCLMPVSENGAFVVLTGFLFGFPMGSKNCAEMLRHQKIGKSEAEILFAVTNNISPVFISSYILHQQLALPHLALPSFLVLYLPPLLCGAVLLKAAARGSMQEHPDHQKTPASESKMNFKIIDAGIMNGFETLTRLGGYIMLFSMAASALMKLPLPGNVSLPLVGFTEITNGISLLPRSRYTRQAQYLLAMAFTAFGGLSGIAQTSSMTKGCGLSLKRYCLIKILCTGMSVLLAWGVTVLFL